MSEPIWMVGEGCLRFLVIGGTILLFGLGLLGLFRQPARRQMIGFWTIAAALIAIPLSALPGWLPIELKRPEAKQVVTQTIELENSPILPDMVRPFEPAFVVLNQEKLLLPGKEVAVDVRQPWIKEVEEEIKTQSAPTPPPTIEKKIDWNEVFCVLLASGIIGYFSIAIWKLGRVFSDQRFLEKLWNRSKLPSFRIAELFRDVGEKYRIEPELGISKEIGGPICFGIWQPRILIPSSLAEIADNRTLRWIFSHELTHLERRDPFTVWLTSIAQSVYFVFPWFFSIKKRMHLDQELLADASVVREGSNADEYASFLVNLVSGSAVPIGATGVQTSASDLFRRVSMLLQKDSFVESRSPRIWSWIGGGALLSLAVVLTGLTVREQTAFALPQVEKVADEKESDKAKPKVEKATKKTADELRKELEEKLKGLDLTDPKFDEIMKEYNKLIEEAIKKSVPNIPNFPPVQFQFRNQLDPEQQKQMQEMMKQQQERMLQLQQRLGNRAFVVPEGNFAFRSGGGRMGISIEKPSAALISQLDLPENQGQVVVDVKADSPAAQSGIKKNDIILEFAGKSVPNDSGAFQKLVAEVKKDAEVSIVVLRKGKKETIKGLKLPEAKDDAGFNFEVPRFEIPQIDIPNIKPIQVPNIQIPNIQVPNFPTPVLRPKPIAIEANKVVDENTERLSVRVFNDEFTIESVSNGREITVKGKKDEDKKTVTSVKIKDGKTTVEADSINKVPEKYRDSINKLLDNLK
jgi:serine protease Do